MATKVVRVKIDTPEEVSAEARELAEQRGQEAVIVALWEAGEMSSSRAAEELGLSAHEFLDLLEARPKSRLWAAKPPFRGVSSDQKSRRGAFSVIVARRVFRRRWRYDFSASLLAAKGHPVVRDFDPDAVAEARRQLTGSENG